MLLLTAELKQTPVGLDAWLEHKHRTVKVVGEEAIDTGRQFVRLAEQIGHLAYHLIGIGYCGTALGGTIVTSVEDSRKRHFLKRESRIFHR